MSIKVDIISGFLGAGKTTLIKKLVSEALKDERVFVLENEFGKTGIDGAILENSNIRVKELNSGCICCSPFLDFMKALTEEAEEFRPARIIVEPSGVALLSEVISQFNYKTYEDLIELNIITTVVDAKKYELYMRLRPEFFVNQIRVAKTILLSKVDSIDEVQLQKVIESVKGINPSAPIMYEKWENIETIDLLNVLEGKAEALTKGRVKKPAGLSSKAVRQIESAEEAFMTFEAEPKRSYSEEELINLLEKVKAEEEYGTILRGKGIVESKNGGRYKFDYVAGDIKIEEFSAEVEARICFIGINLNKKAFARLV